MEKADSAKKAFRKAVEKHQAFYEKSKTVEA